MSGTRIEKDSFGAIEVPAERLWGAQTERSRRFFRISTERMPLAVIHALALADEANDQPTLDLLTQRMQIHEKNAWMLRSLLKK